METDWLSNVLHAILLIYLIHQFGEEPRIFELTEHGIVACSKINDLTE